MDRDLAAFLVQLSIALHKSAAYPPRHPLAVGAVDAALAALAGQLRDRSSLTLGIARTQILIDGEGTDAAHPVLRELAQKLYRREIGGIEFSRGVDADELSAFLIHVNGGDPATAGTPPQWPHIRLAALAFDRLRLAGEGGPQDQGEEWTGSKLWEELARTAFMAVTEDFQSVNDAALDARALAAVIDAQAPDSEYARAVSRHLIRLGEVARRDESAESRAVRRQLSELFANLNPRTLQHLLRLGPEAGQRQALAVEVARTMPVGAVVELVRRSGGSEQTISHSLLRIFSKLASHADAAADQTVEDDESLRDMVHELVQDWVLRDPNPESYTAVLEGLARPPGPGGATATPHRPSSAARLAVEIGPAEARRVLQMALEVDAYGDPVERAVQTLVEAGAFAELIAMLSKAPSGAATPDKIWKRLTSADMLRDLLKAEDPDPTLVEPLIRRLGPAAADALLDALADAQLPGVRRKLLSWLGGLGSSIGPKVVARLDSPHWYVQRNMLVLLGAMHTRPPEFTPRAYLGHPDALVRREALKIALRVPELRDEAISRGIGDADEQNLRMAVASALDGCPAQALPFVQRQLDGRNHSPELRALLIRAVGAIAAPAAGEWLARRCLTKRVLLPGMRLAPKSAELVAAVSALAQRWSQHPRAAEVLRLAARSRDAELQAAAAAGGAPA